MNTAGTNHKPTAERAALLLRGREISLQHARGELAAAEQATRRARQAHEAAAAQHRELLAPPGVVPTPEGTREARISVDDARDVWRAAGERVTAAEAEVHRREMAVLHAQADLHAAKVADARASLFFASQAVDAAVESAQQPLADFISARNVLAALDVEAGQLNEGFKVAPRNNPILAATPPDRHPKVARLGAPRGHGYAIALTEDPTGAWDRPPVVIPRLANRFAQCAPALPDAPSTGAPPVAALAAE